MVEKSRKVDLGLIIPSYWGMFVAGILISFLGPLLTSISASFRLSLSWVGLPVVTMSTGSLLATLAVAFFWEIQRARMMLVFSSLLMVLSLVGVFFLHRDLFLLLAGLFLLGFGIGMLHVGIDSLLSEASGQMRAKYLNTLHMFIGLGGITGPILVGVVLTYTGNWHFVFLLIALLALPLPMFFSSVRVYGGSVFSTMHKENTASKEGRVSVRWGLLFPLVLAISLCIGIEHSFTSWTPVFLVRERNLSIVTASYAISIFWLCIILGRWIFSRFLYHRDLYLYLIIAAAGVVLLTALSFFPKQISLILVFVAGSGLFFSHMFPSLLASGGNVFPGSIAFVTGILTAGSVVGSMFLPWVVGPISELMGLGRGIFVIPLLGIVLLGTLWYFRSMLAS